MKAWKVIHDKGSEKSKPKTERKPRWIKRLEGKVSLLRRQISQTCEEMRRIREQLKMKERRKKPPVYGLKLTSGSIRMKALFINILRIL